MNPATALAFLLSAASVLFHSEGRGRPAAAAAAACALFVAIIAALRLIAYSSPFDAGIDRLLFADKLAGNVMAPNTAWDFLLIAASLVLLNTRSKWLFWTGQAALFTALFVALLAIVGYVYSVRGLYNVPTYIPMALNTATAFVLVSLGVLFLRSDRSLMAILASAGAGGVLARRLIPAAVVIPAVLGALGLYGEKAGYYNTPFGAALMAISNMVVFAVLVWSTAAIVNRTDMARLQAEERLREANAGLEANVRQRTEDLRASNAELQKTLKELKETQRHLIQQERLRALGEMAGGVAHDFNNTLSSILGYSELMLAGPHIFDDPGKRTDYLKTINTAAKDAAKIVNRLREFYRPRDDNESFSAVDMNHLIQQAATLTQPKWHSQTMAKGIAIEMQTDLGKVPLIDGNESELREVLTNLIFNAVDAMPRGGMISLHTRAEDEHMVLEVRDTGQGMSEEVRHRCLEPFFTTKGDQGTGLGLAMVYGIIQRHKALLDIQTESGKGTAFIIRFPAGKGKPSYTGTAVKPAVRPLRILYVEDDPSVRSVILNYLKNDGHDVTAAAQGGEGLGLFQTGRFDLVITDRAMPGMTGEQMSAAIKKIMPQKPIILLSGSADVLPEQSLTSVDAVLGKPVTIDGLREAIRQVMEAGR
jgi:signal transduction histidine kinase